MQIGALDVGIAARLHENGAGLTVARLKSQRADGGEWPGGRRRLGRRSFRVQSDEASIWTCSLRFSVMYGFLRVHEKSTTTSTSNDSALAWRARVLTQSYYHAYIYLHVLVLPPMYHNIFIYCSW